MNYFLLFCDYGGMYCSVMESVFVLRVLVYSGWNG